jgi:hypothetical protein
MLKRIIIVVIPHSVVFMPKQLVLLGSVLILFILQIQKGLKDLGKLL